MRHLETPMAIDVRFVVYLHLAQQPPLARLFHHSRRPDFILRRARQVTDLNSKNTYEQKRS